MDIRRTPYHFWCALSEDVMAPELREPRADAKRRKSRPGSRKTGAQRMAEKAWNKLMESRV
ncbi:MAG: hypothetical protein PHY12_01780 [Eubacteriales bacterium]|nr:hypothetical protein [Eubacteriales bacterium]